MAISEISRLDPHIPCLYESIASDELLLKIVIEIIKKAHTPEDAREKWKSLRLVDRTFATLTKDREVFMQLLQCSVEIPSSVLLRISLPSLSQPIFLEAWKHKHQKVLHRFSTRMNAPFYCEWLKRIPIHIRRGFTTLEMSPSFRSKDPANLLQFQEIAEQMPFVDTLILKQCRFVNASCLHWISTHFPRLKVLDLAACSHISSDGILSVLQGCPELEELNLSHLMGISQEEFIELGRHFSSIKRLHLAQTRHVELKLTALIPTSANHLEFLNLSLCQRLTDDGLQWVSTHCPNLKIFSMEASWIISDRGLLALAQGCPFLTTLNLSACPNISFNAVHALMRSKPNLRSIKLNYCSFTDEEYRELQETFPDVQVHWQHQFPTR